MGSEWYVPLRVPRPRRGGSERSLIWLTPGGVSIPELVVKKGVTPGAIQALSLCLGVLSIVNGMGTEMSSQGRGGCTQLFFDVVF